MKQGAKYSRDELSLDALYDGRIVLFQPKKGYRFSVDSPLLTWFCGTDKIVESCADLGCGCGVIGISLLVAQKVRNVVGVEIQPRLASLSIENAAANGIDDRIEVVTGDIPRFLSGDPTAGPYQVGFYPIMMGGLVGAALAMLVVLLFLGSLRLLFRHDLRYSVKR